MAKVCVPDLFRVYYISCSPTGLGYVGITGWSAERRFARHLLNARTGRAGSLYDAIREHGPAAFTVSFLMATTSWGEACESERRLIEELGTKIPSGFNMTGGGDGNFGYEYTDEVRLRMSVSGKAKRLTEEHRRKIGEANRRRKHGPESIEKMAAAKRGKQITEETRDRMSKAHAGRIPVAAIASNTGKKLTPERIERMRAGMRGKKKSEEGRANIAAAAKARTERLRAEGRLPRPPSPLGRIQSEETRVKIGEGRRLAWAAKKAAAAHV